METRDHSETQHQQLPGRRAFSVEMIAADRAVEEKCTQLGNPDRPQLIKAQKLASKALGLKGAPHQVLKALCSCTRGGLVNKRVKVWPSNAWLMENTGASERNVSRAIATLIRLRLIIAKDAPGCRRFPVYEGDKIVDAYGFDLSPLILRQAEFAAIVLKREQERKERKVLDREIACRRIAVEAALNDALSYEQSDRVLALFAELAALKRQVPRRNSLKDREPVLRAMEALRERAEALVCELAKQPDDDPHDIELAGSACQNGSLLEKKLKISIENYKAAADQRAGGEACALPETVPLGAADDPPKINSPPVDQFIPLWLISEACPLIEDAGPHPQTMRGIIDAGWILRRSIGASQDAWTEGENSIGLWLTAVLAIFVYQKACDDVAAKGPPAKGSPRANPGGLFREFIRMAARGEFVLHTALKKMRQKRLK